MQKIHTSQARTPIQQKWLDRLTKQLVHEVMMDEKQISKTFSSDGGIKILDQRLGGHPGQVLTALNDNPWRRAG